MVIGIIVGAIVALPVYPAGGPSLWLVPGLGVLMRQRDQTATFIVIAVLLSSTVVTGLG